MMMIPIHNPIMWILKNNDTNRFHPILVHQVAFMGYQREDDPPRWKSKGHHTAGFDTQEEAQKSIIETCQQLASDPDSFTGTIRHGLDIVEGWDGINMPLINALLDVTEFQPYEPKEEKNV